MKDIYEFVRSVTRTKEEIRAILAQLAEPFEEEDVKWKPQSIKKGTGSDGKSGQAASYADIRTYIDRLNEVVGAQGWTSDSVSIISGPIPKKVSKWGEDDKYVDVAKIFTTVNVVIAGISSHCDTGESWMDDENAGTIAYAQAFKRACVAFGPGRYFYDLPKIWCPVDKYNKFVAPGPQLPEWAKPKKLCMDCGQRITPVEINVKGDGVLKPFSITKIIENGKLKYDGKKLCFKCQCVRRDAKLGAAPNRVGGAPNTPATKTNGKAA